MRNSSQDGFAMLMVLALGTALFMLASTLVHTYYGVHQQNERDLARVQAAAAAIELKLAP